jgi:hypothetical protein
LHLEGIEGINEKLHQIFMTERASNALIVYAAKLSTLHEAPVMQDLGRYVTNVLNQTFQQDRYTLQNNPHLQKIAENHNPILKSWQEPLAIQKILFTSENVTLFDAQKWLRTKLLDDGHLGPNPIPHVKSLLDGHPVNEKDFSPIENAIKDLLAAKSLTEQIDCLETMEKILGTLIPCQFANDVHGQLGALQDKSACLAQEVSVVDTDDYLDLLLSGTEVIGSCQNVNGSPSSNKGLLGYLLDGKNKLIAVKDQRGHIMARAKLSLLWDGEKPVLFLERLYTQGKYEKQCRTAITEMALAKAKKLQIQLTALKGSGYPEQSSFNKDLQALGSGISYEYSDGAGGVKANGFYCIPKVGLVVFAPSKLPTKS